MLNKCTKDLFSSLALPISDFGFIRDIITAKACLADNNLWNIALEIFASTRRFSQSAFASADV